MHRQAPDMKQPGRYNPSITMPIVDIVVAIVLIVGASLVWHHTRGQAKIQAAQVELLRVRANNSAELAAARNDLATTQRELDEAQCLRDMRAQHLEYVVEQIAAGRGWISGVRKQNEPLVNKVRAQRTEIRDAREQRAGQRREMRRLEQELEWERVLVAELEAQTEQRRTEIVAGGERLRERPASRLPDKSAVAIMTDIATGSPTFLTSISHCVKMVHDWDLGVIGSFGLGRGGKAALAEMGIYASLPLPLRWASFDVVGGIRWRVAGNGDQAPATGSFVGAYVRLAPMPHERFFILAGMVHVHDDQAFRLGVSFGGH